jgi:hypothetical protein|nr:DUF924 family protein [Qipengyuania sp. YIM B01966]
MQDRRASQLWRDVLDFWFPEGRTADVVAGTHVKHWTWRMRDGAEQAIVMQFSELTARGAEGELDHWAFDPHGRLALIIVLDQFSRSLWRGTSRAFAQDGAALKLAMDGLGKWPIQALAIRGSKSSTPCRSVTAKVLITSNASISSFACARKLPRQFRLISNRSIKPWLNRPAPSAKSSRPLAVNRTAIIFSVGNRRRRKKSTSKKASFRTCGRFR